MASNKKRTSAGLLLYRTSRGQLELFLCHPGGPFFANKDEGAWSIPKGLLEEGEEALQTAIRETLEETGVSAAEPFVSLGEITQKGGKRVLAWAACADELPDPEVPPPSNRFELEWPPKSGLRQSFPEVDRAEYFAPDVARQKVNPAQIPLIERLEAHLSAG